MPRGRSDLKEVACLGRLAETNRTRGRCWQMSARSLMTLDELGAALEEFEHARSTIVRESNQTHARQGRFRTLERDSDALLETCDASLEKTLERLGPEDCHRLYRLLRLEALVGPDGDLTVSGAPGTARLASF